MLLHYHRKLGRWLPPGGHIEPGELPDDAAIREVLEETGVDARLVGNQTIDARGPGIPRQLCRPAGIQLEDIGPGHQHIDLIYYAAAEVPLPDITDEIGWYSPTEWAHLALGDEVTAWCVHAIRTVASV